MEMKTKEHIKNSLIDARTLMMEVHSNTESFDDRMKINKANGIIQDIETLVMGLMK